MILDIQVWYLKNSIPKARNDKATEEDMIPFVLKRSFKIAQSDIRGVSSKEFEAVNFVPIPKKSYSQDCSEYRTIALMNHTGRRIERRLDRNLSKT